MAVPDSHAAGAQHRLDGLPVGQPRSGPDPPAGPPARPPLGLHLARVAKEITRAFDDALSEAGGSQPIWLVLISLKTRRLASQRELADAVGIGEATLDPRPQRYGRQRPHHPAAGPGEPPGAPGRADSGGGGGLLRDAQGGPAFNERLAAGFGRERAHRVRAGPRPASRQRLRRARLCPRIWLTGDLPVPGESGSRRSGSSSGVRIASPERRSVT